MIRRYRLPTRDVVYCGFILESYEQLALMTTIEAKDGFSLVELCGPDDSTTDLEELLSALRVEGILISREEPDGDVSMA